MRVWSNNYEWLVGLAWNFKSCDLDFYLDPRRFERFSNRLEVLDIPA